jgi:hypothetical protein
LRWQLQLRIAPRICRRRRLKEEAMAAFRVHVTFSSLLGLGYGVASATILGFTPTQGALAGWMTSLAGMLPDLDLDTGRPGKEIFGVTAAIAPMFLVHHLMRWGRMSFNADTVLLLLILLYLAIRFGVAEMVNRLSVHRGMFHSIPAMFIAADIAFLGYPGTTVGSKVLMAGGIVVGFLSHLILDEIYSVDFSGATIRLKKSAGSALKIAGPCFVPNIFTFALCATLTYAVLVQSGALESPAAAVPGKRVMQANQQQGPLSPQVTR